MAFIKCVVSVAIVIAVSADALAQDPEVKQSKSAQCAQYGSYEDADGQWSTCEEGSYSNGLDGNTYDNSIQDSNSYDSNTYDNNTQDTTYDNNDTPPEPEYQEAPDQQEEPYQDPTEYPDENQDQEPRD